MTLKHITKEKIDEAISKSQSMKQAAEILDVTYSSFIRYANKFGLYNPNQGLKGVAKPYWKNTKLRVNVEKVLANEQRCGSNRLKKLLYKHGLKESKCECCGIIEWNNKSIVMYLDHIDGNNQNNKLDNLQILCPNCHSQTSTYCRGQGKAKATLVIPPSGEIGSTQRA
ncbi:HNH endonuclease signature motif containing protein [Acinetobacter sp.]|uniref:HNH endonuclease signature motif containing protein n=1 Tax=Acinetobacter sp. TaxID=472 RepID=UPI00388EA59B